MIQNGGRRAKRRHAALLAWASLVVVAGCGGGGGGGGAPVAVQPPGAVSVLLPLGPATVPASPTPPRSTSAAIADFPDGADYFTDRTERTVYDPAAEALARANELLCALPSIASPEALGAGLLNGAPYRAQLDAARCAPGADRRPAARATGRSFGDGADVLAVWDVEVARASGSVPQTIRASTPVADPFHGDHRVFLDAALREAGAGDAFGRFALCYAAAPDAAGLAGAFESGALTAEARRLAWYRRLGDVGAVPAPGELAAEVQVAVELQPGSDAGVARVFRRTRFDDGAGDTGILPEETLFAFDDTHVLRGRTGGSQAAFLRGDFEEHVVAANLYEADGPDAGARVEPATGVGFRTPSGAYGWLSHAGLWLPDGETLASGDVVVRDVFGESGEDVSYTFVDAPGRLLRYRRSELDLAELAGHRFDWVAIDGVSGTAALFELVFDPGTGLWSKTGRFDEALGVFEPVAPPEAVDTAALGYLRLWCEALGGPAAFVHGAAGLALYERELVDGSDAVFGGQGELELFGLVQLLRPGLLAAEVETGDVFDPDAADVASAVRYVFDRTDLVLRRDATGTGAPLEPVTLADGVAASSGPYRWGLASGPLVSSTAGVPTVADVWLADELFVWETGPHPWNRFAGLVDASGEFLDLQPPLRFRYRHDAAKDRAGDATFDGLLFVLEYAGPGELRGIPTVGRDLDADGMADRFYAAFDLADGVALGPTDTEYVFRATALEETLREDPAYAGGLDLLGAGDLVVPDASTVELPVVGASPPPDEAPRVIDGRLVGGSP